MFSEKCKGKSQRILDIYDLRLVNSSDGSGYVCYDCVPQFKNKKNDIKTPEPFSQPEDGSGERYKKRRGERPWANHTFWWFIHNFISHPLIVIPVKPFFDFHDWTSRKMHGR